MSYSGAHHCSRNSANFQCRREDLSSSTRLYSRKVVQQARAHPAQGCFPAILLWTIWVHREGPSVDGDQNIDLEDDHELRCPFCAGRGWDEAIGEDEGAFYLGARPIGSGIHEEELSVCTHQSCGVERCSYRGSTRVCSADVKVAIDSDMSFIVFAYLGSNSQSSRRFNVPHASHDFADKPSRGLFKRPNTRKRYYLIKVGCPEYSCT